MRFVDIEDGLWLRPDCVTAVLEKGVRGARIFMLDGSFHDVTSLAAEVLEKLCPTKTTSC